MRFSALDFPAPGSPPMSRLRSIRVMETGWPASSVPRWMGSQMERHPTGTRSGLRGIGLTRLRLFDIGHPLGGQEREHAPHLLRFVKDRLQLGGGFGAFWPWSGGEG